MKRFSIYKIQFKTMMKSKESGKNIIKIRRIYKKSFENKKIIKLLQKILIIVCINSKINHVFERKSDYVQF